MKTVFKPIDQTGRVVVPKYVREFLNVGVKDNVEFILNDNGTVLLKKHDSECAICGQGNKLTEFNGKYLCKSCLEKIKSL